MIGEEAYGHKLRFWSQPEWFGLKLNTGATSAAGSSRLGGEIWTKK